jgi:hypothetical protein
MLFTLEPLRAKEGDCLLLHWTDDNGEVRLAVIDGGPGTVYEDHLLPRLDEIREARGIEQLLLDVVMVSHVDKDHIVGINKLVRDIRGEVEDQVPKDERVFAMPRLWHNAFDDVIGNALDAHYRSFTASFEAAASGEPQASTIEKLADAFTARAGVSPDEAAHSAFDVAQVLAGHPEGRRLRDDHAFLRTMGATRALNSPFAHTLITAEQTPQPRAIAGLKFHIIGPLEAQIEALQEDFDKYLDKEGLDTAEAVLAAYADKSIPNLSSIVCIVEKGGRRILLTGDARGDYVLEGLERAGLLDGNGAIHFDVLKVPHHGSDRNVTAGFFKKVTADVYVLSGDGKHGNPDRLTFDWIIQSRAKSYEPRILLTYEVDDTDRFRKSESRSSWDHDEDSLKALFAARKAEGYKFTVEAGAPITIDLGDESISW